MQNKKLIVFTCNWNAYHALETAGAERLSYPSGVIPIRLICMGRISTGIILKAFEQGSRGVLLLGCPKDDCQYDFGMRLAEGVILETKKILTLLGYAEERLRLDYLEAGAGRIFTEKVGQFLQCLDIDPHLTGESVKKSAVISKGPII